MSCETSGLQWPEDQFLPTFQLVEKLTVYDLRGTSHAIQSAATVIAGIVNRPRPSVYLLFGADEVFWLQLLPPSLPVTYAPATGEEAFHCLLTAALPLLHGVIIYDPALIDTINVATTLAAQCDGIVVSPALAATLVERYALAIIDDLREYHWQSRLQAYHWAQRNLLPQASGRLIAGLDPHAFCALRSLLVATRGFCCWLDTRQYLPPPGKLRSIAGLSERGLFRQLLSALAPDSSAYLGWVVHEQSAVALASDMGVPVIASDYVANLEVWTAIAATVTVPPPVNTPLPAPEKKVYLSFTMSDGDNLQYCQHRMLQLWRDEARGSVPIGWTLTPLLLQSMPTLAAYYTSTATSNDELLCSPSGLAYMYPSHWPRQRLTPYFEQTAALMEQVGMESIEIFDTAFIFSSGLPILRSFSLTGMGLHKARLQQTITTALRRHGVKGILSGLGYTGRPSRHQIVNGITIYQNPGYSGSVAQTVRLIKAASRIRYRRPVYLNIYLMAWTMTPADIKEVLTRLGPDYVCVLPRTLLALLAGEQGRVPVTQ
jgi:GxGYxYP putative glycoside hydrolase C-terminal domain/GxGYxY sequence motif in domain of unknown function N-terminal